LHPAPVKLTPEHASPIILIGLPGSGKSSIGRRLARRLGVSFADTDAVIEESLGCSIRTFFERESEARFRDIEQETLAQLIAQQRGVLATGGGCVLREANQRAMREGGYVIYLHSSPETIFRRLRNDTKRPLLQVSDPLARLHELYGARDPLYRATAHTVVESGRCGLQALARAVAAQFKPPEEKPPQ